MKRRIIYCIFLLTGSFSAKSQTWAPVGSGITGTNSNTTWALCAYDSLLFAGGYFNNAGGTPANNIAQWNGSDWDSVQSGSDGTVHAMVVYKGHLYAGGQFNSIGGVKANNIAMWNGSTWMPVGGGVTAGDYGISVMAIYNGILFAGGSFDSAGGKYIPAIAQWNDTNWSAVGAGIDLVDEDEGVFALAVYKGVLYIAGNFVVASSTNIAQWNGVTMSDVQGGTIGFIYSLAVYNDNLYVGGMISEAGAVQANCIAIWNNATWSSIDSGISGENGWAIVNALTVYNNELYIGGFFDTVNGEPINCITKWNGRGFSSVGSGINVGGAVDAMEVFNGSLYVGGGFDSAGGVYAKNIAMLTSPASVDELTENNKVSIYPSPASNVLYVKMSHITNFMFYTIFNELGEQVETGKLSTSKSTAIDVSAYANGIYLLTVTDGNRQYNTKFLKN